MSPAFVCPQRTSNAGEREAERHRKVDLGGNLECQVSNRSPTSKCLKGARSVKDKETSNCGPDEAVAELADEREYFSKQPTPRWR